MKLTQDPKRELEHDEISISTLQTGKKNGGLPGLRERMR